MVFERRLNWLTKGQSGPAILAFCVMLSWYGTAYGQSEVGGTGTLVPDGGIIHIVGPAGDTIDSILVTLDSEVQRGDVLFMLGNHSILQAELELVQQEFDALKQTADDRILLQELAVESAVLGFEQAKRELANYQSLGASVMSPHELAQRKHAVDQADLAVRTETVILQQRVKNFAVENERARLKIEQAATRLRRGMVTAPRDGTILDMRKGEGETLGNGPAIILGDLRVMYADGDIYEGDILKIKTGMQATITSDSFTDSFTGTVERIGHIIDTDARLAKVLIRLDDAARVRQLVGMQVRIAIRIDGAVSQ